MFILLSCQVVVQRQCFRFIYLFILKKPKNRMDLFKFALKVAQHHLVQYTYYYYKTWLNQTFNWLNKVFYSYLPYEK